MIKRIIFTFILFLMANCSGVKLLPGPSKKDLYTEDFLKNIKLVKESYRKGLLKVANKHLKAIDEQKLLPSEKAMKRNLGGVLLFSQELYEKAVYNFEIALANANLDESLSAQIRLNLGSTLYKLNLLENSFYYLKNCQFNKLSKKEFINFHKLKYQVALKLKRPQEALSSLIHLLKDETDLFTLRKNSYFLSLKETFFSMEKRAKIRFLNDMSSYGYLAVGHLGLLMSKKLYHKGEKEESYQLLTWVEKKFKNHSQLVEMAKSLGIRTPLSNEMDPLSIGVVLPLSGKKSLFSKRVLMGMDIALKQNAQKLPITIHIEDSKESGAVGGLKVKRLIEENKVMAIIGGLFTEEATQEYLEAKKRGVFFISLSPIYLPKSQKDHLLLELPGSIESQIYQVFSPKVLERFGKRAAIIYPQNSMGETYVKEFWRKAKASGVQITESLPMAGQKDYLNSLKILLGLKFKRERQEELEIFSEIHSLEKSSGIRRLQTLRPQIDFDWLFVPSYPQEALQIIPTLAYLDAPHLKIVGGPSWRSGLLMKKGHRLGKLHFVGEDIQGIAQSFSEQFQAVFQKRPKFLEMRGFDAIQILTGIRSNFENPSRMDLDHYLRNLTDLSGITGKWTFKDGVWIKEMLPFKLSEGKISELFSIPEKGTKTAF